VSDKEYYVNSSGFLNDINRLGSIMGFFPGVLGFEAEPVQKQTPTPPGSEARMLSTAPKVKFSG